VLVIRQNPKEPVRKLSLMTWGLIPSWAKDSSVAASMINARAETAGTKPAFRDELKSRRCLIPADGFYEWMRMGKAKQPYCFEVNDGELFAFAGLWDRWKHPSGNWIKTYGRLCGGQLLRDQDAAQHRYHRWHESSFTRVRIFSNSYVPSPVVCSWLIVFAGN